MSVGLVGNQSLAYDLRVLTSIELFQNAEFYADHPHFEIIANQLQCKNSKNLFTQALSDHGCKVYTETKCRITALKEEASYTSRNYSWSSFVCVMALCNVIEVTNFHTTVYTE